MSDNIEEVVPDNIEEGMALVVEGLTKVKVQFAAMGVVFGAAAGAITSYYVVLRKLEAKYNKIAEEEIQGMREHYQAKVVALEEKPDLEEIIETKGYAQPKESVQPPMAIQPPTGTAEAVAAAMTPDEEPEVEEPEVRNVFRDRERLIPEDSVPEQGEWDYHKERRRRTPARPYVIHYDEREETDYEEVTFTYYAEDDALCNEREELVDDRDRLLGEGALNQFGHGSGDPNVVYVRNDSLGMDFEVVQSQGSYAEEVAGFKHAETGRRRTRRSFDDE